MKRTLSSLINNANVQKYSPLSILGKNKRIVSKLEKLFEGYSIIKLDLVQIIKPSNYVTVSLKQNLHQNNDEDFTNRIKNLELLEFPTKSLDINNHLMIYTFTFKYDDNIMDSAIVMNKFNL